MRKEIRNLYIVIAICLGLSLLGIIGIPMIFGLSYNEITSECNHLQQYWRVANQTEAEYFDSCIDHFTNNDDDKYNTEIRIFQTKTGPVIINHDTLMYDEIITHYNTNISAPYNISEVLIK